MSSLRRGLRITANPHHTLRSRASVTRQREEKRRAVAFARTIFLQGFVCNQVAAQIEGNRGPIQGHRGWASDICRGSLNFYPFRSGVGSPSGYDGEAVLVGSLAITHGL